MAGEVLVVLVRRREFDPQNLCGKKKLGEVLYMLVILAPQRGRQADPGRNRFPGELQGVERLKSEV